MVCFFKVNGAKLILPVSHPFHKIQQLQHPSHIVRAKHIVQVIARTIKNKKINKKVF
jgi:hypothetical protein